MSQENVEVVQRLFALVERCDSMSTEERLRQYSEIYDLEVVIREAASLPYGGVYRGAQGVKQHALGFRQTWDPFQSGAERNLQPQVLDVGEYIVVLWRHKAAKPDGEKIELPAVSVYKMRAGRIVESQMFHSDTAALLRFLSSHASKS